MKAALIAVLLLGVVSMSKVSLVKYAKDWTPIDENDYFWFDMGLEVEWYAGTEATLGQNDKGFFNYYAYSLGTNAAASFYFNPTWFDFQKCYHTFELNLFDWAPVNGYVAWKQLWYGQDDIWKRVEEEEKMKEEGEEEETEEETEEEEEPMKEDLSDFQKKMKHMEKKAENATVCFGVHHWVKFLELEHTYKSWTKTYTIDVWDLLFEDVEWHKDN